MSTYKVVSPLSSLLTPIRRLVLISVAGLCGVASAQTAPQLLPYTSKLIAGGGTAVIGKGATCPVSGFTSTDAYGDGCLATEIEIGNTASGGSAPGARSAVADSNGNVFFTDYQAALVRRVDAVTGIVTAVAGGGTTPAGTSSGALGTAVKLVHPAGITFAPAPPVGDGSLYFSDPGSGQVFKVAATNGLIATTSVISLVLGNSGGTVGYAASNATTTVTLANSYLRGVYGIAVDTKGDLIMADEYYYSLLAYNMNTTGTNVVAGVSIPAGQVWKIAGTSTGSTAPYCINGTASSSGCSDAQYKTGITANTDEIRGVYSVAVDAAGNVYSGEEYYDAVFAVSNAAGTSANILSTAAGLPNNPSKVLTRGIAPNIGIGSVFGVAVDSSDNLYISDASSGVIWRVDAAGKYQYVVAGGATTVCSTNIDKYGDGCPATQAQLGSSSGSTNFATTTFPGPGVYGISVDQYANLFFGDTETNLVREIASGTQFGVIGANQPTNTIDIHFAAQDMPAGTAPFTLTPATPGGPINFTLGTPVCTVNSDQTDDCLLPVTATPAALGAFGGNLTVVSKLGGTATFSLSGIYAQSPVTRTALSYAANSVTCTGTTTYSSTTPITLTATLAANGPSAPTGTVTFFANGTQIGTAQNVTNLATTAAPKYGAILTYTFATANTYTLTATYSGDTYFKTSTGTANSTLTSSNPGFTATLLPTQQATVSAGQTGLFSFTLTQNVYAGTITMSCSGLPANSSCAFSPISVTANGCSTTNTVALSILTQGGAPGQASLGGGSGMWRLFSLAAGFTLALAIGLRRRQTPPRFRSLGMVAALLLAASGMAACSGSSTQQVVRTPAGPYTVTVTATGSTGITSTFPVTLTVQ